MKEEKYKQQEESDDTVYYGVPEETETDEKEVTPGIFSLPPDKGLLHGPVQLFLFMFALSFFYWSYPQGKYLAASGRAVYEHGEFWRLLSALFVHGDMSHLLANGWIFILFGWMLRSYFGVWAFPFLAIVAGAVTNAITVFVYHPDTGLIGASGMVHSMVAMWIVWYIAFDRKRSPGQRLLRASGFSLAMLVPAVVKPGVSYLAHGVGFLAGLVVSLLAIVPAKRRVDALEKAIIKEEQKSEEQSF